MMTTSDDTRAKLEAVIWQVRGGDPRRPAADVDDILDAADDYAIAYAQEAIAANADVKAIGARRLTEATNEVRERKH